MRRRGYGTGALLVAAGVGFVAGMVAGSAGEAAEVKATLGRIEDGLDGVTEQLLELELLDVADDVEDMD